MEMKSSPIVMIVSHSGGTFGPLACSNLLQSFSSSIFVVTSEWDTQVGKQLRSMYSDDLLSSRIFSTGCGVRPAEPCSVSVVATHQLLTNIFEHICVSIISEPSFRHVSGAVITELDLQILERCNQGKKSYLLLLFITATWSLLELMRSHLRTFSSTSLNREYQGSRRNSWCRHSWRCAPRETVQDGKRIKVRWRSLGWSHTRGSESLYHELHLHYWNCYKRMAISFWSGYGIWVAEWMGILHCTIPWCMPLLLAATNQHHNSQVSSGKKSEASHGRPNRCGRRLSMGISMRGSLLE